MSYVRFYSTPNNGLSNVEKYKCIKNCYWDNIRSMPYWNIGQIVEAKYGTFMAQEVLPHEEVEYTTLYVIDQRKTINEDAFNEHFISLRKLRNKKLKRILNG